MSVCRGHVVGEGAGVGPSGEVQVVLPCSMFCISAYSVSAIVGILVLCCWSCGLCAFVGLEVLVYKDRFVCESRVRP